MEKREWSCGRVVSLHVVAIYSSTKGVWHDRKWGGGVRGTHKIRGPERKQATVLSS